LTGAACRGAWERADLGARAEEEDGTLSTPIRMAIAGATGHMGRALFEAAKSDPGLAIVGTLARGVDPTEILATADVVVDFTTGAASAALARLCATRGGPALVIGATGFEPAELDAIAEAARKIAIVRSGNFSLGVNMLIGLVDRAARALPPEVWDIEIFEAHHRRKIDAPSAPR